MRGRKNFKEMRKTFWLAVEYAASIQIQIWYRRFYYAEIGIAFMAEMRYQQWQMRRQIACPKIQRIWRGYVTRVKVHELRLARVDRLPRDD